MEALHVLETAGIVYRERRGQTEQEKQNTGSAGWSGRRLDDTATVIVMRS